MTEVVSRVRPLRWPALTPGWRLALLLSLVIFAIALYLTWDIKASLAFTLKYRSKKLITLLLVGFSVSTATLLFQTLSQNRILTPGIMGFDALYVLIQSVLVLTLGVIGFNTLNPYFKWGMETSLMILAMLMMYRLLFRGNQQSLQFMMLAGIIFGILFSSGSALVFRLLDPMQFGVLQDALFATFAAVDPILLQISLLVLALTVVFLWRFHARLDVMLLGQNSATSLGLNYNTMVLMILLLVAILVSLSTALVGPVSFFGLLVVHLAYRLAGSYQHHILIPFAALLGMLTLVSGEFILQHLTNFSTRLSIIIEFFGGLFFLALIIRQGKA